MTCAGAELIVTSRLPPLAKANRYRFACGCCAGSEVRRLPSVLHSQASICSGLLCRSVMVCDRVPADAGGTSDCRATVAGADGGACRQPLIDSRLNFRRGLSDDLRSAFVGGDSDARKHAELGT